MTQGTYPEIIDEEPHTLAEWIRYVTRLRNDDIGNADSINRFIAALTAATIAYDNSTSGLAATDVQGAIDEVHAERTPSGSVIAYGGTAAPTGWLLCDGSSLLRADYPALFTAIGTTYGAADGTHFNVPDIRGRVIAGQDDMGGSSANRLTGLTDGIDGDVLGGTGGLESTTLTTAQIPLHGHPFRFSGNSAGGADTTGGMMVDTGGTPSNKAAFTGTPSNTAGEQIGGTGGGGAHNNVQPTIILNYIIKT